jgi:hypothetical protein
MIPLPELASELALGLGVALFGANALVYLRSRSTDPKKAKAARPPSMARVVMNMVFGAVVALIGLASLVKR